eukprot:CAMPEP_0170538682 /NCGR_PEP_ID=MMETSP0209-20121228/103464_1 /TAXON_ID=665100 ORGANISM="Litonotus pictus, Strain P1" /NCGR_SAMPLE_ID=MMETSP0209 /ASSEMBLY_ACC=CAM_ASM_000301 /LENGTH=1000 /DNA_ID=CAMNT_0010840435 /DNA_START=392 /DNA_END=3391 /DNA_ORIENTATION=-
MISVNENSSIKNQYDHWYNSSVRNIYLSSLYLSFQNLLLLENKKEANNLYKKIGVEIYGEDFVREGVSINKASSNIEEISKTIFTILSEEDLIERVLKTRLKLKYDLDKVIELDNNLLLSSQKVDQEIIDFKNLQELIALNVNKDYNIDTTEETLQYLINAVKVKLGYYSLSIEKHASSEEKKLVESIIKEQYSYIGETNGSNIIKTCSNSNFSGLTDQQIEPPDQYCEFVSHNLNSFKLLNLKDLFYPAIINTELYSDNSSSEKKQLYKPYDVNKEANEKLREIFYVMNNFCFPILIQLHELNQQTENLMNSKTSYGLLTSFLSPIFYVVCLVAFIILIATLIQINYYKLKILKIIFLLNKKNGEKTTQICNMYLQNIQKVFVHKNPETLIKNDKKLSISNNPQVSTKSFQTDMSYGNNTANLMMSSSPKDNPNLSFLAEEMASYQLVVEDNYDDLGFSKVLDDVKINEINSSFINNMNTPKNAKAEANTNVTSNNNINYFVSNKNLILKEDDVPIGQGKRGVKTLKHIGEGGDTERDRDNININSPISKNSSGNNSNNKNSTKNPQANTPHTQQNYNSNSQNYNSHTGLNTEKEKDKDKSKHSDDLTSETGSYVPAFILKKKQKEYEEKLEQILEEEIDNTRSEIKGTLWFQYFKILVIIAFVCVCYTIKFTIKLRNDNSLSQGDKYKNIISQRAFNYNAVLIYYGKFFADLNYYVEGTDLSNSEYKNKFHQTIDYDSYAEIVRKRQKELKGEYSNSGSTSNTEGFTSYDALGLFLHYFNKTQTLESQIHSITTFQVDSILQDFFDFENSVNTNKQGLCDFLTREEPQDEYKGKFYSDCYTNTTQTVSSGLQDGISKMIYFLNSNYKEFDREIRSFIDKEISNTLTIEEFKVRINNKKMLTSLQLLFQDTVLDFNDLVQYYLNPTVLVENQAIYSSIVKFIDSTYELDFIISPIFWVLLFFVFLFLLHIHSELKTMLATDKTILLFIPAEMINENDRI